MTRIFEEVETQCKIDGPKPIMLYSWIIRRQPVADRRARDDGLVVLGRILRTRHSASNMP
jgi:hypothetical protein